MKNNLSFDIRRTKAILIGVSRYQHLQEVTPAENNIADFKRLLMATDIIGLPEENIITIVNKRNDEIDDQLVHFAEDDANVDIETLVVYYVGHGIRWAGDRTLYLTGVNSKKSSIRTSGLSFTHITQLLETIPCRNRVLIIDACHSGLATLAGDQGYEERELTIKGSYILASTAWNEPAFFDAAARNTVFSGQLLAIMETGIPEQGPVVSLDTLFLQLRKRLTQSEPQRKSNLNHSDFYFFHNVQFSNAARLEADGDKLMAEYCYQEALIKFYEAKDEGAGESVIQKITRCKDYIAVIAGVNSQKEKVIPPTTEPIQPATIGTPEKKMDLAPFSDDALDEVPKLAKDVSGDITANARLLLDKRNKAEMRSSGSDHLEGKAKVIKNGKRWREEAILNEFHIFNNRSTGVPSAGSDANKGGKFNLRHIRLSGRFWRIISIVLLGGGFIWGVIATRESERDAARKQLETVDSVATVPLRDPLNVIDTGKVVIEDSAAQGQVVPENAINGDRFGVLTVFGGKKGVLRTLYDFRQKKYIVSPIESIVQWPDGLFYLDRGENALGWFNSKNMYMSQYDYSTLVYTEGLILFRYHSRSGSNSNYGYCSPEDGTTVIPALYKMASPFSNGIACVVEMDNRMGFIDKKGTYLGLKEYESYRGSDQQEIGFYYDRAMVGKNHKYGYVGRAGKMAIPAIYDSASRFKVLNGVTKAEVKVDGRNFFIGLDGMEIVN